MTINNHRLPRWTGWTCHVMVIIVFLGFQSANSAVGVCRDSGIWIADGLADCDTLVTPSFYGVHRRPGYYCTVYPQTDCCATCTRLGYRTTAASPAATSTEAAISTPAAMTTEQPTTTVDDTSTVGVCRDSGIWIADGLADCDTLVTPSFYGVHRRPGYYCTVYPQTDCCATCTRLGYRTTAASPAATTTEATISTPAAMTTEQPTTTVDDTSTVDVCLDSGIWIADGQADCDTLVTPSFYGVHRRPGYYCTMYPQTDCCATCTRLGYRTTAATPAATTTEAAISTPAAMTTEQQIITIDDTSTASTCQDRYIWLADGDVTCDALIKPTAYGVHRRPDYYCSTYPQTDCCATCTRLGHPPTAATHPPVTRMPTSIVTTTIPPVTTRGHTTSVVATDGRTCRDVHIWIFDVSVGCDHLERKTAYGIHTRQEYYCTNYSLTECCETCTRLGFPATNSQLKPARVTMKTTTVAKTTTQSNAIAESKLTVDTKTSPCKDAGIWMGGRLLPCRYLQQESSWMIDRRPIYYCNAYPLTDCCRTCRKVNGRQFRDSGAETVGWYRALWILLNNS